MAYDPSCTVNEQWGKQGAIAVYAANAMMIQHRQVVGILD